MVQPGQLDAKVLNRVLKPKFVNVLFVEDIAPDRGHECLLQVVWTYKVYVAPEIKLYAVGECRSPAYLGKLRSLIAAYDLVDNIVFIADTNEAELNAFFLASTVLYLHVGDTTNLAPQLLRARKFDLPVMGTNTEAARSQLGTTALLVDAEPLKLALGVEALARDRILQDYFLDQASLPVSRPADVAVTSRSFL